MSDGGAEWERWRAGGWDAEALAAVSRRLVDDPAFALAWLRAARFDADLEALVRARAERREQGHPSVTRPLIGRRRASRGRGRWIVAAAALLALLAAPLLLRGGGPRLTPAAGADIVVDGVVIAAARAVAPGARIEVRRGSAALDLADGTRLDLAAPGDLRLDRVDGGLAVTLVAGRVAAQVAPQPVPAEVRTAAGDVRVVDTAFTIDVDAEGTRLAVVAGAIELARPGRSSARVAAGARVSAPATDAWFGGDADRLEAAPDRPLPLLRWTHHARPQEPVVAPIGDDPGAWALPRSRRDMATVLAWAETSGADLWLVLPLAWDDATLDRLLAHVAARLPSDRQLLVQLGREPWNIRFNDGRDALAQAAAAGAPAQGMLDAARWALGRARALAARHPRVEPVFDLPWANRELQDQLLADGLTGIRHLCMRAGLPLDLMGVPRDSVDEALLAERLARDRFAPAARRMAGIARDRGLGLLGYDAYPHVWMDDSSRRDRERFQAFLAGPAYRAALADHLGRWRDEGRGRVVGDLAVRP